MKKRWDKAELDIVKSMYFSGSSDEEISIVVGRSVGSVSNIRQFHKINRPNELLKNPRWSKDELDLASDMYGNGHSRKNISLATGRSLIAIKRAITSLGWKRYEGVYPDASKFNCDGEVWVNVFGFIGLYIVSDMGRVMSIRPGWIGHVMANWTDDDDYVHTTLTRDGKSIRRSIHSLVLNSFVGPPPVGYESAHKDANPGNNRLENLTWKTKVENQADRLIHGTADRWDDGKFKPSRHKLPHKRV